MTKLSDLKTFAASHGFGHFPEMKYTDALRFTKNVEAVAKINAKIAALERARNSLIQDGIALLPQSAEKTFNEYERCYIGWNAIRGSKV